MNTTLDKDRDYQEKITEAALKHAAHVASEELLDEMTDKEDVVFSERHEENMRKLFASMEPKTAKILRPKRILILVAVLVFVFAVGATALRPKIMNLFLNTTETNTEIRYEEAVNTGDTYVTEDITLGYVPEGMQLVKQESDDKITVLQFQREQLFFYVRMQFKQTVSNLDTQVASSEKIKIQSLDGFIQEKDGLFNIKWYSEGNAFSLLGNLSREELIKIAENIQ